MTPKRLEIKLKEGARVILLLTPSLYGVGKARGIDLVADLKAGNVMASYMKIAYCAAISAWEVDAVDNPGKGAFPYCFSDFEMWAWSRQEEFKAFIDATLLAFTGKGIADYSEEPEKK